MKKIIIALLFPTLFFAQQYELGKVSKEELLQKKHPKDTSAVAAILFHTGKSYFEFIENSKFVLRTEISLKIKIYKKDGLDYANKEIAYYVGGNANDKERVDVKKSFTYNLVNGDIEKTKLYGDGEFKEAVNENWNVKKVTMPNVKEGSIIEIQYTIESPYFSNLQDWKFQSTIPVDYSEYTTVIPEYFTYNYYVRGSLKPIVEKNTKSKTIEIYNKELVNQGVQTRYQNSTNRLTVTENITTNYLKDVPPFKQEPYSNNIDNYLSGVQYELASIKYPNDKGPKMLAESWEDVVKNIYKNENFGSELKNIDIYNAEIEKLIGTKTLTQNEKISVIFDYVKNNFTWNERYSIYSDKGVKKAFKDKTGNVAEINFILITMLQNIGVNASPVILNTRSKAINLFPSRTAFNYVICVVEQPEGMLMLDATSKHSEIDVLPTRALNYFGRIVRVDGTSELITLAPNKHAKKALSLLANIGEDGIVKGDIKEQFTLHRALNFRNSNNHISTETYLENIEKDNPGFEIENYNLKNKEETKLPIQEIYSFSCNSKSEILNNKLYFKPFLIFSIDENPFKLDSRDYPIDFIYPINDYYTMTYTIPEGYIVESVPEKLSIAMVDNLGLFTFVIETKGNKVQMVSNLFINSPLIGSNNYLAVKAFYNEVFLKMNEKIVLKKKS
jgi:hypothetical protein